MLLGGFIFVFPLERRRKKTLNELAQPREARGLPAYIVFIQRGKICMNHLHNIKQAPVEEETLLPQQRSAMKGEALTPRNTFHRVATKCSALKHPELRFKCSLREAFRSLLVCEAAA